MKTTPLIALTAAVTPLVAAGMFVFSAGSHGSTPSASASPAHRQHAAIREVKHGVVRIVGRYGDGWSSGTGFVIDSEGGYVVTNAHVVDGVSSIKATVGAHEIPAQLVAVAACDDLAVLKLARVPDGVRALPIGDSSTVTAGQRVRAFGFPDSLDITQMSVTQGTVTAADVAGSPGGDLPNFASTIQHQAPLNAGNSGGPLVDDQGRVVGVNTLSSTTTQGQYYSISSSHLKSVLPGLLAGESKDDIGWSLTQAGGLSFDWHDADAADYRATIADNDLASSMYIMNVKPGSAADRAGLEMGDLVTAIEGSPVESFGDVCDVVQSRALGHTVSVSAIAVDRIGQQDWFTVLEPTGLRVP